MRYGFVVSTTSQSDGTVIEMFATLTVCPPPVPGDGVTRGVGAVVGVVIGVGVAAPGVGSDGLGIPGVGSAGLGIPGVGWAVGASVGGADGELVIGVSPGDGNGCPDGFGEPDRNASAATIPTPPARRSSASAPPMMRARDIRRCGGGGG